MTAKVEKTFTCRITREWYPMGAVIELSEERCAELVAKGIVSVGKQEAEQPTKKKHKKESKREVQ